MKYKLKKLHSTICTLLISSVLPLTACNSGGGINTRQNNSNSSTLLKVETDAEKKSRCAKQAAPEVDWHECNKSGANLTGANLTGANLEKTKLYNTNLNGTIFKMANLKRANLNLSNLTNANFESANASSATFINASVNNTNFEKAKLYNTNFEGAYFLSGNFKNANLKEIKLKNVVFSPEIVQKNANLAKILLAVKDVYLTPLKQMSDTLKAYTTDNFSNDMYSFSVPFLYGNDELTLPASTGWIGKLKSQYAFGYNAPYIQTYSPSPRAFLSPLIIKLGCKAKDLFLVLQPVTSKVDTKESKATQKNKGINVIVKYHSLYSDGINYNGYDKNPPTVNFTLKAIDNVSYDDIQQIVIRPHDGVWSGADNNEHLQTAFLDYKPHIITTQMDDINLEHSIYSVNALITNKHITEISKILDNLPPEERTLQNFKNIIKTNDGLLMINKALETYGELVASQCNYKLWSTVPAGE